MFARELLVSYQVGLGGLFIPASSMRGSQGTTEGPNSGVHRSDVHLLFGVVNDGEEADGVAVLIVCAE